jgi:hypothetical protein
MSQENISTNRHNVNMETETDANFVDLIEGKYNRTVDEDAPTSTVTSKIEQATQTAESPADREAAIASVRERLTHFSKETVQQQNEQPDLEKDIPTESVKSQEEQENSLLAEMERQVGSRYKMMNEEAKTTEEKIRDLIKEKAIQDAGVRKKFLAAFTGVGVVSLVGGLGGTIAGVSGAVALGVTGLAVGAVGAALVPPALYIRHLIKENKRVKKYQKVYGTDERRDTWLYNSSRGAWG